MQNPSNHIDHDEGNDRGERQSGSNGGELRRCATEQGEEPGKNQTDDGADRQRQNERPPGGPVVRRRLVDRDVNHDDRDHRQAHQGRQADEETDLVWSRGPGGRVHAGNRHYR
jgi:hypothetical protein